MICRAGAGACLAGRLLNPLNADTEAGSSLGSGILSASVNTGGCARVDPGRGRATATRPVGCRRVAVAMCGRYRLVGTGLPGSVRVGGTATSPPGFALMPLGLLMAA
eukprot:7390605-Prymnesium_polylepis.1